MQKEGAGGRLAPVGSASMWLQGLWQIFDFSWVEIS